eukprot:CAMPEP_0117669602 /NCGR_PEP_ID=MMETSP0804-20121206/12229_1 /TAXON_ID=1074897 /ORGANISM="Tetraselmis astigmatica, Strain CCMP880" /LENGTH=643 /DNA_ID=CAMNT_0005477689 /DNA_START=226 /DNA_END=2157 /DNA_ORIENTATION=+
MADAPTHPPTLPVVMRDSPADRDSPFSGQGPSQGLTPVLLSADADVDGEASLLWVEAFLASQGMGVSQALLLLLTSLITFTSGLEIYLLSLIGLDMQCYWHITPSQAASLFSIVFLGKCIAEPVWGGASDAFGRRPIIILLCLITAAAAMASAFAPSYWWFAGLRFVFALALPVDNIVIVWLLELLPPSLRGVLGSALGLCWVLASVASIAAASILLERFGWQLLVAIAAVPAVLSAVAAIAIPESPLWLANTGQHHEAQAVVQRISDLNRRGLFQSLCCRGTPDCSSEAASAHVTDPDLPGVPGLTPPPLHRRASLDSILSRTRNSAAVLRTVGRPWVELSSDATTLLMSLLLTSLMGVAQSSANLLPQQAAAVHSDEGSTSNGVSCTSPDEGAHLLLSHAAYRGLLVDSLGGLPGLIIGVLVIDRLGRLTTLGAMQILAIVTWLPLLFFRDAGASTMWLTGCVFVVQWWYTACLTVNNVWQVEVFPTSARSLGVALNGIVANLGNVISPYMTALLVQEADAPRVVVVVLQVMGAVGLVSVVAAMCLGLETAVAPHRCLAWPSKLYRAMSVTTASSTLHCIWDVLEEGTHEESRQASSSCGADPPADRALWSCAAVAEGATLGPSRDSETALHGVREPLLSQ